ncbi:MAG: S9 family peptidase [Eubacterium sp.]|nr:S9 family peptidase [Eubacterium sp.]
MDAKGNIRQLTQFNTDLCAEYEYSRPEPFTFTDDRGVEIDGWVMKPADFDENKTYPAILDVHGGPKTVYGSCYFHEMQLWASEGYFVFFCNPVGGDGRGDTFADIRGIYGGPDYEDIMQFTDEVLKRYPQIDPARVGVTGGSYGGFMTNWIIGHTDRFAAAASQRSIANWLAFYETSDIGYFFAGDQAGGTPWTRTEKLWDQSPLKYADRVKTPTLFIHSDQDYRCPLSEGIQMFTAIKDHGVEARMCIFKGENHELSRSGKPKHRVRRLKEITEWFSRFLKETD